MIRIQTQPRSWAGFSRQMVPKETVLSTRIWRKLKTEERQKMGYEILALICPDWRPASLVLDARSQTITYANWRCLQMLKTSGIVQSVNGRVEFQSMEFNDKFRTALDAAVKDGHERSFLVGQCAESEAPYSVVIHNSQGFFREILDHYLDHAEAESHLVILEFTVDAQLPDLMAVQAFARAYGLTATETQLVQLFGRGMSLEEIAEERNVTLATTRQQMKAVLGKTRCTRQRDLARVLFSICPAGQGRSGDVILDEDA